MRLIPALAALALNLSISSAAGLDLSVASTAANSSSNLLYGILYEDIYHSGDGGLYAELIRNRAFQGSNKDGQASTERNLDYWHAVGDVTLSLDTTAPALSSALPDHLRLSVPAGTTSSVGVYNEGFWGMKVMRQNRYETSFYLRGTYSGNVELAFYSNTTGKSLGKTTIRVSQTAGSGWKLYSSSFSPSSSAPDRLNTFRITFDGKAAAGQKLDVNLVSVFPETFKGRDNGLRQDLAEALVGMGTKYLRMPGGNNMQGNASPYRWKWNETIGPLRGRPGRPGVWGDLDTTGLGLLELMQWSVDMNMEVILGVWGGLYLNGEIVAKADLQPYIDDVLHELEFLTGSTQTKYGALRASLGFKNPFKINYIEIGNEDYLNGGIGSYADYRFPMFYDAIHAAYPQATIISTISIGSLQNPAPGVSTDDHIYVSSAQMVAMFNRYDHVSRQYPIFVSEYAAIHGTVGESPNGQLENPTLESATAEAVLLLGCERNSDIVLGTSYGALIKSLDETPDNVAVIKHNADSIVFSFSYYVQKLFASYHGSKTVSTTSSSTYGPLYWSTTVSDNGQYFVKVVNFEGAASTPVTVTLDTKKRTAKLITLTGTKGPGSVNGLGDTQSIWSETAVNGKDGKFSFTLNGSHASAVLVV